MSVIAARCIVRYGGELDHSGLFRTANRVAACYGSFPNGVRMITNLSPGDNVDSSEGTTRQLEGDNCRV